MAVMARDTWTDERLDDLNAEVDRGFAQVDKRFEAVDRRFERVEDDIKEFRAEVNGRFDSLNRLLVISLIGLLSCMFTGFASLAALVLGS